MVIGGLDVGSTGIKITVINGDGQLLHSGYREYTVSRNANAHEIDANEIWHAAKLLIKDAAEAVPGLSAIGVTSFGESFVLLDENGGILYPTMLYTDPRGMEEIEILKQKLGDRIAAVTGAAPHSMYSLPKLMWIKEHEREIWSRTKCVCLIGDFLVYKLTGRRLIDYSLAARTMGLDIKAKEWSREVFDAAGVDSALLSAIAPTGTLAGAILPEVSSELGLRKNIDVVICGHDQVAAAVGANTRTPGIATDGGGTVQCVTPVFTDIPQEGGLQKHNYSIIPFLTGETYCSYAFTFTGGALVKWYIDQFMESQKSRAAADGITIYDYLERQMRDEPTGILVLPHFAGAATPYMDNGSKGAFVGLELSSTYADLYRAILEGIAYEIRINKEALESGGVRISGMHASGGCAKSRIWLQIKADILGVPITRMGVDEAGTIGGIMLTGVAIGAFAGLDDAASVLVEKLETYYPRPDKQRLYETHYQRYKRLYESVRPLAG